MKTLSTFALLFAVSLSAEAKVFQNSYVSFEVPDSWTCVQEGVAWTCTPQNPLQSKEAVIVLAAKVAGPEDNLINFLTFLKQPKRITTKVGTPMPSKVMYAQERQLAGTKWIQAQHLGSEIQEYYTLYLATVKDQLAILVSFTAEYNRYNDYNPVFDKAIKTLKIIASQQLLFPKKSLGTGGSGKDQPTFGIQGAPSPTLNPEDLLPPPEKKPSSGGFGTILILVLAGIGIAGWLLLRKKQSKLKAKAKPKAK